MGKKVKGVVGKVFDNPITRKADFLKIDPLINRNPHLKLDPVEAMTIAPNSENNALAIAAAARELQRRNAGRGRAGTALSMSAGGSGTLG